jgi:hypothetical protein
MSLLKAIEEPDVKASLWKSQTLNEMNWTHRMAPLQ